MKECPDYEYDEEFDEHICHGCICPEEYVDTCKYKPSSLMYECTGDCNQCSDQFQCPLSDASNVGG